MAQSGSYDFTVTRDQIIGLSYQHIGAIGEGESPSTAQVTEAALLLNLIVKLRAADGMPTWAMKRGFILPFTGASSINTNSHVVTNYDTTTLTADSAASDTTLTVSSITGFTNADQLGVELDDGSVQWTTVSGVPAGTTITIATGTTSAASTGNRVYGYTASTERVQKPLRIISANSLTLGDARGVMMDVVDSDSYYSFPDRTTEGSRPTTLMYTTEPSSTIALETNGQIFLWPRFEDGATIVEFTYQRPFQDFDAASDNPDFPQVFHLPLMLELAALLGPRAGLTIEERRALFSEAKMYRDEALSTIESEGSFYAQPDSRSS